MKEIVGEVNTFADENTELSQCSVRKVCSSQGNFVRTYSELIGRLAQLAYGNPEFVLLFRGQMREYPELGRTTLFPSMYRVSDYDDAQYAEILRNRYKQLKSFERKLFNNILANTDYREQAGRSELARWAILQHYEKCPTPLLDVTSSALVACSFSFFITNENLPGYAILYVLGFPQISGSITVSPHQELQVVRLSGVCPPEILRPYFQEGYLVGTYPSVLSLDTKNQYKREEMDCSRRLIAKFRISTRPEFWDLGLRGLTEEAVYPVETNTLSRQIDEMVIQE